MTQTQTPPADPAAAREHFAGLVRDALAEHGTAKAADLLGMVIAGLSNGATATAAKLADAMIRSADLERQLAKMDDKRRHAEEQRDGYARAAYLLGGFRQGARTHEEGETGSTWAVFPATMSDERIMETLARLGWALEGWRCCSGVYDCCGRIFGSPVYLSRKGSRVVARQSWGRDV